jgi:subtilisin family serine protease
MSAGRAAIAAVGLAAGGLMLGGVASAEAAASLNARAAAQIGALQRIKASLSPAERKLDSRLVVALRERRSASVRQALPRLRTNVALPAGRRVDVDIRVTSVTRGLEKRLLTVGARVRYASTALNSIRAAVPTSALGRVAGWKDVRHLAPAVGFLREAGPVDSEGDKAHAANIARALTHVTGTGVKVCVLSDGVDSLAAEQAAGELPAGVDVIPGQEGFGDEGTAMLEIVHDLAPHAQLGFATADNGDASFADNIRALRFQHHCDVIVDDILYFDEDPFQDGPIARAVNAVTGNGALYFSSAGNEGNTLDHTSGNYEGDFSSSGQHVGKLIGIAHDFDPGPGVQVADPLSDFSAGVPVTLWWADPLGHSGNDYDVYELDAAGNVLAFSQNVQDGNDDPYEQFFTTDGDGIRLAVVRYSGATRYFQLSALRGRFVRSADGLPARVTPGVERGHADAVNALSVAAAPAAEPLPFDLEPGDPANPGGPFPNPFTAVQRPERFTSDGPRRMFFSAAGTPFTPGNFTHTGGVVRRKPDITAADGVSTGLGTDTPFNPFFGTSAAAPHAAAIAALVLSGNPGTTTAELRSAFAATAPDLAPAGVDARSGRGILRADSLLAYTGATPQPLVTAGSPRVVPTSGDGDAYLEPGETASVTLPVTNVGDGAASGINVTVASDDSRASVTPHAISYGTLARGATASRTFSLALAPSYPNGRPVRLAIKVAFVGRLSPTARTVAVRTGQPAATVSTFSYTGPPVAIPDDDPAGASVSIHVAGLTYASSVSFVIGGQTCTTTAGATTVGISHTFVSDLAGTLTGPGGQTARLFDGAGEDGHNMCQVRFLDSASRPFATAVGADAPFTGDWGPLDPLATFLASPVAGTWTFKVVDQALLDTGSIRAVSLQIRGFAPA